VGAAVVKTIYIVMGTSGEYSDRDEWPVCAYSDKERAQQHVVDASNRARVLSQWRDADGKPWRYSDAPDKPTNEYDPDMLMDYTETSYFLYETELR
jgi:hypothetical protein